MWATVPVTQEEELAGHPLGGEFFGQGGHDVGHQQVQVVLEERVGADPRGAVDHGRLPAAEISTMNSVTLAGPRSGLGASSGAGNASSKTTTGPALASIRSKVCTRYQLEKSI